MYKYSNNQTMMPCEFFLPFGGKLNPENRWCKLASLIHWEEFEEKYVSNFKSIKVGHIAFSGRIALGSLIIQNYKSLSDRQTVEEIVENPYLQYFIGLTKFIDKAPFTPSLMVHFRKRLGKDIVNQIPEMISKLVQKSRKDKPHGKIINSKNTEIVTNSVREK